MNNVKKQNGDFLIEALIGMVLLAIIGLGIVHTSSRATVVQRNMYLQEIAINSLRTALLQHRTGTIDVCNNPPTIKFPIAFGSNPTTDIPAEQQGCTTTSDVTFGSAGAPAVTVARPIVLSVLSNDLLGGRVVVGGSWDDGI